MDDNTGKAERERILRNQASEEIPTTFMNPYRIIHGHRFAVMPGIIELIPDAYFLLDMMLFIEYFCSVCSSFSKVILFINTV